MDQKLKQDDDVTGTTESDSERDVYQVRIQEIICLFDTGADAPYGGAFTATLRGANGPDLGAMGEVQVRGFIGKIKVQFTAVAARDARR